MFLRNYIDRLLAEKSKIHKKRNRIFDQENYDKKENSAPLLAPRWTRAEYNGKLKRIITDACKESGNITDQESDVISNLRLTYSDEGMSENEEEEIEKEEEVTEKGDEE